MCWGNGTTELVGAVNQGLVYLEATQQAGAHVLQCLDVQHLETG